MLQPQKIRMIKEGTKENQDQDHKKRRANQKEKGEINY